MSDNLERLPPTPRPVPLRLSLALRLGGVLGTMGWIFFTFTMVFVVVMVGLGEYSRQIAVARAEMVTTSGVGAGWEETSTEVNEQTVVRNFAAFKVKGELYECHGYALDRAIEKGAAVPVQYSPADPTLCKIDGMSTSSVPPWVFLILLPFLLVGGVMILFRWRRGGRFVRLLRHGQLAWGTIAKRESTGVRINDELQWKFTFQFEDERGQSYEVEGRTTEPDELTDEPEEAILYDPARPERAVIVDTEPDLVRLGRDGRWRAPPALKTALLLIGPLITGVLLLVTALVF